MAARQDRSEFTLIQAFLEAFDRPRIAVGPGDDAAVLAASRGELCVTTDAVVDGVHFRRATFSLEDVGHKALAVNLSDLAAMGAAPRWFVCAIAAPRTVSVRDVRALGRGMASLARRHRIALVGGNFTAASELSLTLTAAGEVPRGKALLRSGGHPGDLLYVSGTLGDARLGLEKLGRGEQRRSGSLRRQLRPEPRMALGGLARRFASGGLDISDGLLQDLGHLCARSGVGARVEVVRLPVSAELRRFQQRHPEARRWPLSGGEDYELLLAVPPGRAAAFERACSKLGERVSCIGQLVAPRARGDGIELVGAPAGKRLPGGFDHFARTGGAEK